MLALRALAGAEVAARARQPLRHGAGDDRAAGSPAVVDGSRRDWRLGHEIALCGRLIKGYGATNERGKENLLHVLDHLATAPCRRRARGASPRRARSRAGRRCRQGAGRGAGAARRAAAAGQGAADPLDAQAPGSPRGDPRESLMPGLRPHSYKKITVRTAIRHRSRRHPRRQHPCASLSRFTAAALAAALALATGLRAGPGQAGPAQDVELGAGPASAQPQPAGLGRRHQEGVERHHHRDAVPVRAAGQGLRPLRHGARRHHRLRLRQPGLPAGPLPDHGRRLAALPVRQRQGRHRRHRRLVQAVRGPGNEGRQGLLRLRPRPGHLPRPQEDHAARPTSRA